MRRHESGWFVSPLLIALMLLLSACGGSTAPAGGASAGVALKIYQSAHPARGYVDANGLYTHINPGQFEAYGGSPLSGYTWTVTSGTSMPFPGMIIDPLTGLVHGTLPVGVVAGSYPYQVTVSDGSRTYKSSGAYIVVAACNSGPGNPGFPSACNANLPPFCGSGTSHDMNLGGLAAFEANKAVGFSLTVSGGTPPYKNWTVLTGSLPPGLTLDASRGVVHGTPLASASGNTYTFTIRVSDAANVLCPAGGDSPSSYSITID